MSDLNPTWTAMFKSLAEGELSAEGWAAWWAANYDSVSSALNAGERLRLKPRGDCSAVAIAFGCQREICAILDRRGIAYTQSSRYSDAWQAESAAEVERIRQRMAAMKVAFEEPIARLKPEFPKLAKFLKANTSGIDSLGEPATEAEIAAAETYLGERLPESYRRFLLLTREFVFGETVQIGLSRAFRHPPMPDGPLQGRLCFGDCWLEGDGDQVVFGPASSPDEEPCVQYYDHTTGEVRLLAEDFHAWAEGLPRVLKDC